MADAKANKSVYSRMRAKLGTPNNGTGAIDPAGNVPGAIYHRQAAASGAANGKALYKRKSSGASAANTANDSYQTKGSTKPAVKLNGGKNASGKNARFAD